MEKFEKDFMAMDSLRKVRWVLERITYKPGWTLTADWEKRFRSSFDPEAVLLTISTTVKDINREGHPEMPLTFSRSLSGYMLREMRPKEIIEHVIRRYVWHFEEHEMDEWLKFEGVCIHEPHPEQAENPGRRIGL